MNCPQCQTEVKQNELVSRSTKPSAVWYEMTGTELHCPKCDTKVMFSFLPQAMVVWVLLFLYA